MGELLLTGRILFVVLFIFWRFARFRGLM